MVNRVILQGRLVNDIEVVQAGGFPKTEFTVAWSEKFKDTEKQCFLRCVAWRSTAEFLDRYFKKGSELVIEGQMITNSWTSDDGKTQSRTICNVEKVHFCGSKSSNAETLPPPSKDTSFIDVPDDIDGELPFK